MTASNVAFHMAMQAQRATHDDLVCLMRKALEVYAHEAQYEKNKNKVDEAFNQLSYIAQLICIKKGKHDPIKYAEAVERSEKLDEAFNIKIG
jgi:hypothetical protein